MCRVDKEFILCTCLPKSPSPQPVQHHKKSKRWKRKKSEPVIEPPLQWVWKLLRYAGPKVIQMDGMLMEPDIDAQDLRDKAVILKELNQRNCFDFDYELKEGDCLEISAQNNFLKSFEFIVSQGVWVEGGYDPWQDEAIVTKRGHLSNDTSS
ncbi:MAG: hypothetical protein MK212_13615 [Saprospiraceae bacterium]|nr:hypothetical protein [Saprospiraceae bacterium]